MKKTLLIILSMFLVLGSCSGSSNNTESNKSGSTIAPTGTKVSNSPAPTQEVIDASLTAEDITNKLKASGVPIDNIIVYTEETDENKLLGKPGNYTSKTNFADTRLQQFDSKDPSGGTIEVFESDQDAIKRKEYIETVTAGVGFAQQHLILHKNVLLRVENELTIDQAKEYENKLVEIL